MKFYLSRSLAVWLTLNIEFSLYFATGIEQNSGSTKIKKQPAAALTIQTTQRLDCPEYKLLATSCANRLTPRNMFALEPCRQN